MAMLTSRGEFLTRGMSGGLALVAGGSLLATAAGPALGQAKGDVAIAKVLGMEAPKNLMFTYPDATFASAKSIATTGTALEEAFVGAYMGAIPALSDNGLKVVAAQIGANEAQHLTALRSLAAGGTLVPNPAFPKVLTAAEAAAAVTPFLG